MKKFIKNSILFFGIPLILLVGIYAITDPFKTLNTFDLKDVSIANRDYLSTELFLRNNQRYNYDSFIFGSSRGCGINTYYWRSFLSKNSKPFLFQAWGENITGIYQKIKYLDEHKQKIKNAIILIDIPGSLSKNQNQTDAISIKHYLLSGKSKFYFQFYLFLGYLKPSEIFKSIIDKIIHKRNVAQFDTVSNDWEKNNQFNWQTKPSQNRTLDKSKFGNRPINQIYSKQLITNDLVRILNAIQHILIIQNTNYKIIITPAYDQICINKTDLKKLMIIFGKDKVFNFSGKNRWTEDKYNFMDINHFDLILGYDIIKTIYRK